MNEMQRNWIRRALILLFCILLAVCLATGAGNADLLQPLPVVFVLLCLTTSVRSFGQRERDIAYQPLSFLSLQGSRAPPPAF